MEGCLPSMYKALDYITSTSKGKTEGAGLREQKQGKTKGLGFKGFRSRVCKSQWAGREREGFSAQHTLNCAKRQAQRKPFGGE